MPSSRLLFFLIVIDNSLKVQLCSTKENRTENASSVEYQWFVLETLGIDIYVPTLELLLFEIVRMKGISIFDDTTSQITLDDTVLYSNKYVHLD